MKMRRDEKSQGSALCVKDLAWEWTRSTMPDSADEDLCLESGLDGCPIGKARLLASQ